MQSREVAITSALLSRAAIATDVNSFRLYDVLHARFSVSELTPRWPLACRCIPCVRASVTLLSRTDG